MARNGETRINNCFVCNKNYNFTCSRCGEFYCSKQCQSVDWPDHKYVCFTMPDLIMRSPQSSAHHNVVGNRFNNIQEHSDQKTTPESEPKTFIFADAPKKNEDVILLNIRSGNTFWIRACSSDGEYTKNAKDFDQHGRNGENLSTLPQKNDCVLVRHERKFVRALVLHVESEAKIEVALADIGRIVTKPMQDMRQLSDDLIRRKRYNFRLVLEHIPKIMEPDSFTRLLNFVNNRSVFTIQFDGDDWLSSKSFKLLKKDSGLPIEQAVRGETKNFAAKKTDSTEVSTTRKVEEEPVKAPKMPEIIEQSKEKQVSQKKISIEDLTTETLPEVADLIILDNSSIAIGCVSVISRDNVAKLSELHAKVDEYGNVTQEEYKPEPDEMCLAKFDDEWYRALYCPPNFCLIDYGSSEVIEAHNIRKLPEELNDPCYTFFGNIQGFSAEQKDHFLRLLTVTSEHQKCICVKDGNESNEYTITFPSV